MGTSRNFQGHGRKGNGPWLTVQLDENHSSTGKGMMIKSQIDRWGELGNVAYIQVKSYHHFNSPSEVIWSASGQNYSTGCFSLQPSVSW